MTIETSTQEPASGVTALMQKALAGDLSIKEIPDYSNRGLKVDVQPNMPWSEDGIPFSIGCDMNMLRVKAVPAEEGPGRLEAVIPGYQEGGVLTFDEDGLRLLGHQTGFKVDFIQKLPVQLRAEVVNEMCKQHRSQIIQLSGDGEMITQLSPGWRHLCAHSEIAQLAFNTLQALSGGCQIDQYQVENGRMMMKLSTEKREKVSAKRGDVLSHGVKIIHIPGVTIASSLYTKRLACENGMTTESEQFSWSNQKAGSIEHQLDFLVKAINNTVGGFEQVVKKAKEMIETEVKGDPLEALLVRAKAMKIPNKFVPHLVEAYNAEPGNNEWIMVQALTRFATHATAQSLTNDLRESIQSSAGSWTASFDMVNVRLPRPIAEFAGGEIINN